MSRQRAVRNYWNQAPVWSGSGVAQPCHGARSAITRQAGRDDESPRTSGLASWKFGESHSSCRDDAMIVLLSGMFACSCPFARCHRAWRVATERVREKHKRALQ
jgi:hypothetical protein